jgi:DNA (cytosine-5)-methyltransferase 1
MDEDISTVRARLDKGKPYKSRLVEAIALAPTPSGNWPTPTVSDIYTDTLKSSQQTDGSMHSVTLPQAVQMWPTPTHGKLAGGSGAFQQIQDKYENNEITLEEKKAMQAGNGGRLNPNWVEWLMGFPIGWTDLEDLETP